MNRWLYTFASPSAFYPLAQRTWPWFAAAAVALTIWGMALGLFMAPADAQQGEAYRIIFVHVPVSWMSMWVYLVMAFWALLGLTLNTKLSGMMCRALAPTGALCALLSLWTGALWGKPMWGTWWVWDARLTSELILLFLYLGYVALTQAIEDPKRADQAGGLLLVVGALNVPVIYFSVRWWNTLHQGASVTVSGESSMHPDMLQAMLVMSLACWMYTVAMSLYRVRTIILQREHASTWVQQHLAPASAQSRGTG
jgi:heme exporter protein C